MRETYMNQQDAHREIPLPGEKLKLVEGSSPVLGGECDLVMGFIDKKNKFVYVPDGTIITHGIFRKKEYRVNVKYDRSIEGSLCMGFHKDRFTLTTADEERKPIDLNDFYPEDKTFTITRFEI